MSTFASLYSSPESCAAPCVLMMTGCRSARDGESGSASEIRVTMSASKARRPVVSVVTLASPRARPASRMSVWAVYAPACLAGQIAARMVTSYVSCVMAVDAQALALGLLICSEFVTLTLTLPLSSSKSAPNAWRL